MTEAPVDALDLPLIKPIFQVNNQHTGFYPVNTSHVIGTIKWRYQTEGGVESGIVIGQDDVIYIGDHSGFFYAINPDGTEKWKIKIADPIHFMAPAYTDSDGKYPIKAILATPAIDKNGVVYINTSSHYLHAINPDGTEKWKIPFLFNPNQWNSPTIGPDGILYIGSGLLNNGEIGLIPGVTIKGGGILTPAHKELEMGLFALNSEDGSVLWHFAMGPTNAPPAFGPDGTIYIAGSGSPGEGADKLGKLFALDEKGNFKWEFSTQYEWVEGTPSIGSDGTIYLGSIEGILYALNPDGSLKWQYMTRGGELAEPIIAKVGFPDIDTNKPDYFASKQGGINCSPAIDMNGNIYFGSWDGNFYALSPEGEELWVFDTKVGKDPEIFKFYPYNEAISGSPALSMDGNLYFGDIINTFWALNINGKELWRHRKPYEGVIGSAAIGRDGTVYAATSSGGVIAFGCPENQLGVKDDNSLSEDKKPQLYNLPFTKIKDFSFRTDKEQLYTRYEVDGMIPDFRNGAVNNISGDKFKQLEIVLDFVIVHGGQYEDLQDKYEHIRFSTVISNDGNCYVYQGVYNKEDNISNAQKYGGMVLEGGPGYNYITLSTSHIGIELEKKIGQKITAKITTKVISEKYPDGVVYDIVDFNIAITKNAGILLIDVIQP